MKDKYLINRPGFQCETHPSNEKHYVNGCCKEAWCSANLTLNTSKMFERGKQLSQQFSFLFSVFVRCCNLIRLHVRFLEMFFVFFIFLASLVLAWSSSNVYNFWSAPSIVCHVASCMHPWFPDFWMCHQHPTARDITFCCTRAAFCTSDLTESNLTMNLTSPSNTFHNNHSYFDPFPSSTVVKGGGNVGISEGHELNELKCTNYQLQNF